MKENARPAAQGRSLNYAVFGQPIAHSRSPGIHAAFGRQFGLSINYRRIESDQSHLACRLAEFAEAGGLGANLTLPLKEMAASLCDAISVRARRAGSINTLIRRDGGWTGDSTDGVGLLADLQQRQRVELRDARVLIIGAGGAARAAAAALLDSDLAELNVANRTLERAQALCAEIDPRGRSVACRLDALDRLGRFDVVINATSAGHGGADVALAPSLVDADSVAYDLSYGAAALPFLRWARHAGAARAIDGVGMLVEQAAAAFTLWHGVVPDTALVHRDQRDAVDAVI